LYDRFIAMDNNYIYYYEQSLQLNFYD
jgi:hypothetical protein